MLITVFGGAAQGLDEYAQSLYPDQAIAVCKAAEAAGKLPGKAEIRILSSWEEFARLYREQSENEMLQAAEALLASVRPQSDILILSMTECGCGIVPLGAHERLQRERCGILLRLLCSCSDRVDRVMGGLGICLKGQEWK